MSEIKCPICGSFAPGQGAGPWKDVWSNPQGRGYLKAAFFGHYAVEGQQELSCLVRAGDGTNPRFGSGRLKDGPFQME